MASFTDRIKLVFDVDKNAGTSALKSFKTDFAAAEGASAKFKTVASGGMNFVKENAVQMAAVAGAAIAGFAVHALGAFQDMARQAKVTADATGLSKEQASRWIAVADDAGVSAEAVAKSFGMIVKNLDKDAWSSYGLKVKDASGNLKSTNELMLDAFDVLAKMPPELGRAAAGNALFGRSYKDLAPLVGATREEIEKQLKAVEKGQVITDKESATAEKMREAQDKLKDAIDEVTLAVGQQVAKFAPFISGVAKIIERLLDWQDKLTDTSTTLGKFGFVLETVTNPVGKAAEAYDVLSGKTEGVAYHMVTAAEAAKKNADAMAEMDSAASDASAEIDRLRKDLEALSKVIADAETAAYAKVFQETSDAFALAGEALAIYNAELDSYSNEQATAAADASAKLAGQLDEAATNARLAADETERLADEAISDLVSSLSDVTDEFEDAASAASAFDSALNRVIGGGVSVEEANRALLDGEVKLKEARKENGKSLDLNTEKGRANREVIQEQVENIFAYGSALIEAGGSNEEAANAINVNTQKLKDQLVAQGMAKDEVDAYVASLGATPENVATAVTLVGNERIAEELAARQKELDLLDEGATAEIQALIDEGDFKEAKRRLDELTKARNVRVTTSVYGAVGDAGTSADEIERATRGQSQGIRGGGNTGVAGPDGGTPDPSGMLEWSNGEWVAAPSVAAAAEESVDDQLAAQDRLMSNRLTLNKITLDEYLAYLDQQEQAEIAAGRGEEDRRVQLFLEARSLREQQAADVKAAAEAEAQAVADAEQKKRDEYEKTAQAYKDQLAAAQDNAQVQADLEVAIQKQGEAQQLVVDLQARIAKGGKDGKDAQDQLGAAQAALAAATFAGAKARAALQFTPGTAEFDAAVRADVAGWGASHGGLGANDQLSKLVAAIPTADQFAAAMAAVLNNLAINVNFGGSSFSGFVSGISAAQQARQRGAT